MKRILVVLLLLAMVVSSVSACKPSDDNSSISADSTEGLSTIDYSQPVKYTYWLYATPGDFNSDYNNNPVVEYVNKKFNMTLSFQQPSAGSESDALNLMLGTGEYTDVIDTVYYMGSLTQLYEDGVIIDISKYLDYMPNLKALIESNEMIRKLSFNDDGQMLKLPYILSDEQLMWGGLVYRQDILETMTGNSVAFPSGNNSPTTVADWDYMLPLFKQYFEASGMTDYAPLILPAKGYFDSGDLVTGFGAAPSYYADNGEIEFGPVQDGFYNYLSKMNEWYIKGYIYKDFASRTNDLFYLPNTALTYGGAAGIWFGLSSQLGDVMSMPDYGLFVNVQAAANPIDTSNGITSAPTYMFSGKNEQAGGAMISSTCENVERLLSSLDYLYSEEASYLKGYGLTAEQGAAENDLYVRNGLADGTYAVNTDGTFTFNSVTNLNGGTVNVNDFIDNRTPGLSHNKFRVEVTNEIEKVGSSVWLTYGTDGHMPYSLYRTSDEEDAYMLNQSNIDDYVNTMVLKFILGDIELNETTWADFKAQIISFGLEDNIAIQQASYDRYLAR